jgi:AraC-like DNA-binding protein
MIVEDGNELNVMISEEISGQNNLINAYQVLIKQKSNQILTDIIPTDNSVDVLDSIIDYPENNHIGYAIFISNNTAYLNQKLTELGKDEIVVKPILNNEFNNVFNKLMSINEANIDPFESILKKKNEGIILSLDESFLFNLRTGIDKSYSSSSFNIEQLSKDIAMSKVTLYRKCFSILKQNPSDLLLNYRLNKACELLRLNSMSIGEISEKCGFKNSQYFSTVFKRIKGVSPKQFT